MGLRYAYFRAVTGVWLGLNTFMIAYKHPYNPL